jgi:hypothetical protein
MEGQTTPPVEATSTPAPAPVVETTPAPTVETSYSDGGAMGSITSGKMNIKDIVISALVITMAIYVIISSRKTIQKLDEQLSNEEIDDIYARLDEHEENLKKAMGKNYKTT